MTTPQFEFKLNIVSLGNFIALLALLGTLVSWGTRIESTLDYSQEQRKELMAEMRIAAAERKVLFERDADIRAKIGSVHSQLTAELSNVRTELRVLTTSVGKLESVLERILQRQPEKQK